MGQYTQSAENTNRGIVSAPIACVSERSLADGAVVKDGVAAALEAGVPPGRTGTG